ncbi:prolyl 3-hydroxylase 2 isoform X2 [Ambystoma mexicanum]|uniref:prolyl 3-hydroxylase 2 isoform X2 n=1 Tax=Ambystoma mexicanum TaxID=8296 RepID=UPI0037E74D7A
MALPVEPSPCCRVVCTLLLLLLAQTLRSELPQPYDLLYEQGVDAFYRGDYHQVVHYMEGALNSHAQLRETRLRCRRGCRQEHPLPSGHTQLWELAFFRSVLARAACVRYCQEDRLGSVSLHHVSDDVKHEFYRRIPYNYLQRAYYKLNQLDKAAEAAHTFFMANPEHREMEQSIADYKTMSTAEAGRLIDRERRPHMEDYRAGVRYYDAEQYEQAIEFFEEALGGYYQADEECRLLCEGPQRFEEYDYVGYSANLYEAISDHYIQTLVCEHECVRELATRPGRLSPVENFLPLHYDFLQFAYYRVGDHVKALECARSYLLFHIDDKDVSENVAYYESLLPESIAPEDVQPREEAVEFVRRHRLESEIIQMAAAGLGFEYAEPEFWISSGPRQDENRVPTGAHSEQADIQGLTPGRRITQKIDRELKEGGPLLYDEVTFVHNSEQLNGTQRVQLDNVLTVDECREIQQITHAIMQAGDGYRGKTSPHTPNEKFEGATVLKALKYGSEGRVPLRSARLFYDVSEKARRIIESYFMLNSTLYFSYTHLVCRTALHGQQDKRNDLSHPIHADNCLLDPEANECWKEAPAYTYRDYSALLYLNGDFDGGEFVFTEMDAKTVTASIKPRCGRLVGFSSGGENPHGVKAVTRGQRCAVALWFTLDPLYRELHLEHA